MSIKPIKNDSTLSCRHAVQRINSSHPSQAALVRLEWELTSSRISHFLPVFIRNLGRDSSDPSHPDKYMPAKGGQSPRSLCPFLCAFLISAHLSSNSLVASGFSTWERACVLAVCCSHQLLSQLLHRVEQGDRDEIHIVLLFAKGHPCSWSFRAKPPPLSILTFTYELESS